MFVNPMYTSAGSFDLGSGELIVTDPCYDKPDFNGKGSSASGGIYQAQAQSGKWDSFTRESDQGEWGIRVAELYAIHEKYDIRSLAVVNLNAEIGVDSGQAGIFDNQTYQGRIEDGDEYERISSHTLNGSLAGCVEYGCVSSSGFGDGGYILFGAHVDNRLVYAHIIYMYDDKVVRQMIDDANAYPIHDLLLIDSCLRE